mgnify:CR=1 FL=1
MGQMLAGNLVTFSTDSVGNINNIIVPKNTLGLPIYQGISVIVFGDSMTHRINSTPSVANGAVAITRASGVATVVIANHGMGSGQIADINNAADSTFNLRNVAVTAVNANTLSYACPGADTSAVSVATKTIVFTNQSEMTDCAYWWWLQSKTQGAFRLVRNSGVASNTSADMTVRLSADVLAYASDWIFYQVPLYNDVVNAGYTAAQIIVYSQAMLAQMLAAGRKVLLIGPPAMSTGLTAARIEIYLEVMKWMQLQAQTLSGVYFSDTFFYSVDPINATPGTARANVLLGDNVHESPLGSERKAQAIVDAIGGLIPKVQRLVTSNADNYGASSNNDNIWDYGPWTNAGGVIVGAGVSGVAPSGFTCSANLSALGTAVYSCPVGTDGVGYSIQGVLTSTGASNYLVIQQTSSIPGARFTAGNKIRLVFRFKLTNVAGSNLQNINAQIQFGGNFINTYPLAGAATNSAMSGWVDGIYTFVGPDLVIPAGSTNFQCWTYFNTSAAGSALTVQMERISMRKIS